MLSILGKNVWPDKAKIAQFLEKTSCKLVHMNILLVRCNSKLKESPSLLNQTKLDSTSLYNSINTTKFYIFSCNFSHLEHSNPPDLRIKSEINSFWIWTLYTHLELRWTWCSCWGPQCRGPRQCSSGCPRTRSGSCNIVKIML